MLWGCICNEGLADRRPIIRDTQHLQQEAQAGKSWPCYWLRGIIPYSVTYLPEPSDDENVLEINQEGINLEEHSGGVLGQMVRVANTVATQC